jgi:flagellar biosynthesis protein FliP
MRPLIACRYPVVNKTNRKKVETITTTPLIADRAFSKMKDRFFLFLVKNTKKIKQLTTKECVPTTDEFLGINKTKKTNPIAKYTNKEIFNRFIVGLTFTVLM